jgi:membrane associated rhomboid family serine protease
VTSPAKQKPAERPWWLWWREPSTWRGALALMILLLALLWIIELIDLATDHSLLQYGLRPRSARGLEGIITCPFLHTGVSHLTGNSAPFVLLGWFVMITGFRSWLAVTAIVVVVGGLGTWLVAPSGIVVGASALVMGWFGYLVARAVFSRKIVAMLAAVAALIYFGSLLGGLLPNAHHGISWQGHVCGFAAGILAAFVLHRFPVEKASPPPEPKIVGKGPRITPRSAVSGIARLRHRSGDSPSGSA